MKVKATIQTLRPHQWIKNGFIFLPLFFYGQLWNQNGIFDCLIYFVSFSLAASSIYCFNDICDVKTDRLHPIKQHRPVVSPVGDFFFNHYSTIALNNN
jgi:4-hydroxybenzoate polyprenyltransferase